MAHDSRVKTFLSDMDYPADRADLLVHAHDVGAPKDLQRELRGLPPRWFRNVDEVEQALVEG